MLRAVLPPVPSGGGSPASPWVLFDPSSLPSNAQLGHLLSANFPDTFL